jgi:ribosomal protein S18 acetylase RimI-like enzyme
MEKMLKDLSESSLMTAIESNLFAFFLASFKEWSKAEIHDTPELMWSITEIPFPLFNGVLRARLSPDTTDDAINAAITRCKSKNVPMLWWTGPSTQPSDLGSRLSARGFQAAELPGMAADLNTLPENVELPEKLAIQRVASDEALETWCRVLCTAFEFSDFVADAFFDFSRSLGFDPHFPYRNYLGYLEDEPVSTSSLFLGAGVAGIYNVTTLKEARRKGIGTAMTAVPLVEARSSGYRVGILHSSESGFKVYRNLGFIEYCKIFQYIWSDE